MGPIHPSPILFFTSLIKSRLIKVKFGPPLLLSLVTFGRVIFFGFEIILLIFFYLDGIGFSFSPHMFYIDLFLFYFFQVFFVSHLAIVFQRR